MYEMLKQAWGLTFPGEKFPLSKRDVYEVLPQNPTCGPQLRDVGEETAVYIVSQYLADVMIWLHETYGGDKCPLPAEYDPDVLGFEALNEAYIKHYSYGLHGSISDTLGRLLHDETFQKKWLKSGLDVFSFVKENLELSADAMWRTSETPRWLPFHKLDLSICDEVSKRCREKAATFTWPVGVFKSHQIPHDMSLMIGRECGVRFGVELYPSEFEISEAASAVCTLRHDAGENFIIIYGHIAEVCDKIHEMKDDHGVH